MPMLGRLKEQRVKTFCIDTDSAAIAQLRRTFRQKLLGNCKYINSDFLRWSHNPQLQRFDCIVMNPPFAADKSQLRQLELTGRFREIAGPNRYMPLEAAFVCRAVEVLRNHGRLMAVLPSSIVTSDNTQWLRDSLLEIGAIRFVHELPPRCFPSVESRMYLFVFDKNDRQRRVVLLNHDLADPERLDLNLRNGTPVTRLDFGYHRAFGKMKELNSQERFGWQQLRDLAVLLRGDVASPLGPTCAVHTSDYTKGYWRRSDRHRVQPAGKQERRIARGDLLLQRVGRNSLKTLGRPKGLSGLSCSDCVLLIRTKDPHASTRLLFSLQALFAVNWTRALLERGTGASYISHERLLELSIPTKLHECFPRTYASYLAAHGRKSFGKMLKAAQVAGKYLERVVTGESCID